MNEHEVGYSEPLVSRYASREMVALFSETNRIRAWRLLWVALSEGLKECGYPITDAQIVQMRSAVDRIDFAKAAELEGKFRHDVMAHIHAFGLECPEARPIIHLGATSAFVTDNADLMTFRAAIDVVAAKVGRGLRVLRDRAVEFRDLPVLAYTHFQPAQLTTLGKRFCLWAQDLLMDLKDLEQIRKGVLFRSAKGTTGTQASFLYLLGGDPARVRRLERLVSRKMGFDETFPVTGQTYPRKLDARIFSVLSGIAQSASKFGTDIRLLSHTGELEEPFEAGQVGSSAMAYKRNPMRSERICSLGRYLITLALNPALTAGSQWLERSLDDSANRRLAIPRGFMIADAIMILQANVASGLKVNLSVVRSLIEREIPFQVCEAILMRKVSGGADRQEIHERLRTLSLDMREERSTGTAVEELIGRLADDPVIGLSRADLTELSDPKKLAGMAPLQVDDFVRDHLDPVLSRIAGSDQPIEGPKV